MITLVLVLRHSIQKRSKISITNLHRSVDDILSHSRSDNFNHGNLRSSGLKERSKIIFLPCHREATSSQRRFLPYFPLCPLGEQLLRSKVCKTRYLFFFTGTYLSEVVIYFIYLALRWCPHRHIITFRCTSFTGRKTYSPFPSFPHISCNISCEILYKNCDSII